MSGTIRLRVKGGDSKRVAAYLPANYQVTDERDGVVIVEGSDYLGWTADEYVIPRLASGLMWAEHDEPECPNCGGAHTPYCG